MNSYTAFPPCLKSELNILFCALHKAAPVYKGKSNFNGMKVVV